MNLSYKDPLRNNPESTGLKLKEDETEEKKRYYRSTVCVHRINDLSSEKECKERHVTTAAHEPFLCPRVGQTGTNERDARIMSRLNHDRGTDPHR